MSKIALKLEKRVILQAMRKIKFIDLFAGIGGIRLGFEQAARELGIETQCVMTSEIKEYAIEVLKQNHPDEDVRGDITKINASEVPDFDFLLAGFPCQAFSAAGKRLGFMDTRGTMFFEVERILKEKQPFGFVLENVEGLVNHDKVDKNAPMGRTLETILGRLDELGYKTEWKILNSRNFGLAQERKRIYIVGSKIEKPSLDSFPVRTAVLGDVLEKGLPTVRSKFINQLLSHYSFEELFGKSIKDKRGGENNIHSWDIEMKGEVSDNQKKLLNELFKQRRKKKWAEEFGIDWMDGMPLTFEQISTFFDDENLMQMLEDLVVKGYLCKEHPKRLVTKTNLFGESSLVRKQDETLPLGYNIVTGKLSFEVNKILDPQDVTPTLVAMDMKKLFVVDNDGIRTLSLKEGLRLFGYPDDYQFNVKKDDGYDLLGNTVAVPVIKSVAGRLLEIYFKSNTKI